MEFRRQFSTPVAFLFTALALTSAVGCKRSETVAMSGAITLNAKPVPSGTLVLTPLEAGAGPSTGTSIENGRYDIAADRGPRRNKKYRVEISSIETPNSNSGTGNIGEDQLAGLKASQGEQRVFAELIPAIYNSESTLEITVPNNVSRFEYDFQLKKE